MSTLAKNLLEAHFDDSISHIAPVCGGDINEAIQFQISGHKYFAKFSRHPRGEEILLAEETGLKELESKGGASVPGSRQIIRQDQLTMLVMQFVETQNPTEKFFRKFGQQLAHQHRCSSSSFGFKDSNFIGLLEQSNTPHDSWPEFYTQERIIPQVKLAVNNGYLDMRDADMATSLCKRLDEIYPIESPSLLHGDLWSGNYLCDISGDLVLIDPSVYYGHREMDLAMSLLFGGFSPGFYSSYEESFPMLGDWRERIPIGQLYYLLVHVNLFGTPYTPGVRRILWRFGD